MKFGPEQLSDYVLRANLSALEAEDSDFDDFTTKLKTLSPRTVSTVTALFNKNSEEEVQTPSLKF